MTCDNKEWASHAADAFRYMAQAKERKMAEFDRFRSFAERYVIERAGGFVKGEETTDAWQAILDARTIYNSIGNVSKNVDVADTAFGGAMQAGVTGPSQNWGSGGQSAPPSNMMSVPPFSHEKVLQTFERMRGHQPTPSLFRQMINSVMGKESK